MCPWPVWMQSAKPHGSLVVSYTVSYNTSTSGLTKALYILLVYTYYPRLLTVFVLRIVCCLACQCTITCLYTGGDSAGSTDVKIDNVSVKGCCANPCNVLLGGTTEFSFTFTPGMLYVHVYTCIYTVPVTVYTGVLATLCYTRYPFLPFSFPSCS